MDAFCGTTGICHRDTCGALRRRTSINLCSLSQLHNSLTHAISRSNFQPQGPAVPTSGKDVFLAAVAAVRAGDDADVTVRADDDGAVADDAAWPVADSTHF